MILFLLRIKHFYIILEATRNVEIISGSHDTLYRLKSSPVSNIAKKRIVYGLNPFSMFGFRKYPYP